MKVLIYRQLLIYLLVAGWAQQSFAQKTSLVKTLEQSFEVNKGVSFELTNKYGDVVINGWDKDQFDVTIKLTTYGKDDENARKMMDRIEFDFNVAKNYVIIETIMDREKGMLSEFFSTIGDYSKTLLNKSEIDIDFEINIPNGASIEIDNKFGDIVINDVNGKITINQSHGNFKSGNLTNLSRINVSYGNIDINQFKLGNINIRGGDLELRYAEKVNITSNSSELFLKKIDELKLNSTSDKVHLSEVGILTGSTNFSNIDIYRFHKLCQLDQSYGEMVIHQIDKDFESIKLKGKSTDYHMNFQKGTVFSVEITAREDKLKMIENPLEMQSGFVDDKEKIIRVEGTYGTGQPDGRQLQLESNNGEVIIDFVLDVN